ncbi:DUF2087 domain-containing protein [Bacillus sp. NEB1478]|uniref:DUF2087 domain-containing protein n=1 Tax=Bacillus sp. NEB1478 TaxID=3073816 RepID=UPI002873CDC6|nr:DUF2087 domain-containing protein [Bacillus sp. NEB1478]WNB91247.1 DUF2087 domain-containing protein [Bacillus sp. NEB1478]
MQTELENYQASVIRAFFDKEGKLKNIPSQKKKKLVVLEHIIRQLDDNEKISEPELNQFIKRYHEDFCTIRREFIINGFMERESGSYMKRPEDMWVKWQELK